MNVFSEIRERYPAYQIAIFKITAPALRLNSRIFVLADVKTEKIKLHIFFRGSNMMLKPMGEF